MDFYGLLRLDDAGKTVHRTGKVSGELGNRSCIGFGSPGRIVRLSDKKNQTAAKTARSRAAPAPIGMHFFFWS